MPAQPKQHAIRRSTRLPLEVPILVTSLDATLEFSEECTTTLVNAHGCGLITQRPLPRDLAVRLEIVRSKRHTTARVADVVALGGEPETWLLGMELDTPGNFWGIEYAPSDWKNEIDETPAPTESGEKSPESGAAATPSAAARRWRLTDISAGACYLEATEPLPIDTPVLVSIRVAKAECLLDGIVRASHPQAGMGVEFTSLSGVHRSRAEELISRLVDCREVPRVFVGRKEGTQTAQEQSIAVRTDEEDSDPLLDLVRMGDSLPIQAFLDDLKAQRLGERREPRIDVSLSVELSGADASGNSFAETVKTRNVSRRGAQLEDVRAKLRPGDKVSIAYAESSDIFHIAWVGASLTPLAGQIGVVTIENPTSLWDPAIEHTAGLAHEAANIRGPISGKRK